jgi:hypothetical protein
VHPLDLREAVGIRVVRGSWRCEQRDLKVAAQLQACLLVLSQCLVKALGSLIPDQLLGEGLETLRNYQHLGVDIVASTDLLSPIAFFGIDGWDLVVFGLAPGRLVCSAVWCHLDELQALVIRHTQARLSVLDSLNDRRIDKIHMDYGEPMRATQDNGAALRLPFNA